MKKTGFILLQISGYLILAGGISDIAMTFFLNSLPEAHINYLQINKEAVSAELINLDFAFLRAIGGCLIGTGIGALTIIYTLLNKKVKWSLAGLVGMVTTGEGINASQMFMVHSPYFIFPVACVIIAWTGALLFWVGDKKKIK